jgi:serine/threonine protein kinase
VRAVEPQPIPSTTTYIPGSDVGPYRLVSSLGRGGMAEVFLAEHRHLGHMRAVKVLLHDPADVLASREKRLLTEARAIVRLDHPAIIKVFECDTLPTGGAFLAMELLEGEPAGAWLERIGSFVKFPQVAAALVGTVADALGHAHRADIVHRDLKPDNLFLIPEPSGRRFSVKVLDFGVAKILHEKPLVSTRTGYTIGTPVYMAPEQWHGKAGTIDHRADIYALGCVFYELLCGQPPFLREDGLELMKAHLSEPAPPIRTHAPEIPEELEELLGRMLAKQPDRRPQAMDDVVTALEGMLGRERARFGELLEAPEGVPVQRGPVSAATATRPAVHSPLERPQESTVTVAPPSWSRRQLAIAVGAAVAVAGLGAVLAGRLLFREARAPEPVEVHAAPATPRPAPPPPTVTPAPPPAVAPTPPVMAPVAPKPAEDRRPHPRPPRPKNVYQPVGD